MLSSAKKLYFLKPFNFFIVSSLNIMLIIPIPFLTLKCLEFPSLVTIPALSCPLKKFNLINHLFNVDYLVIRVNDYYETTRHTYQHGYQGYGQY